MKCHYYALVWSLPRTQGGPGGQRTLGVNDAVAGHRKAPAQRVAQEYLMPIPVPYDTGGSAYPPQNETRAENRYRERPPPREWRNKRGGHSVTLKILPKLPDMRVHTSDAFFSEHGSDHQW